MLQWLRWLLGVPTEFETWRQSVYAEARSRGLTVREIVDPDGNLLWFQLDDPRGRRKPIIVTPR